MLAQENGQSIGKFIFTEILCRWGSIAEIVTDNGTPIITHWTDYQRDIISITFKFPLITNRPMVLWNVTIDPFTIQLSRHVRVIFPTGPKSLHMFSGQTELPFEKILDTHLSI